MQSLIDACITDDDKLYLCVSSPTIKDKPVQIRPWRLSDADFVLDASMPLDPRKTVFVGGVPRPLKAGMVYQPACTSPLPNAFVFQLNWL